MNYHTNLAATTDPRISSPVGKQHASASLRPVRTERRAANAARRAGWFLVVVLVVGLFGMAAFHSMIIQQQRQVDGLNAELVQAQQLNDELRVTLTQLEAPDRILTVARDELGMIYVEPSSVTWLEPPSGQLPEGSAGEAASIAQP